MKKPLPKILVSALAFTLPVTLSAQSLFSDDYDFVRTAVTFNTSGLFTPDNPINFEAAGNTISAADFMARVAAAHANNHGGVINFEDSFVVNTGVNTSIANETMAGNPLTPTPRTNLRAQNLIANLGASGPAVTIGRGSQWIIEDGGIGNRGDATGPGLPSPGDNNIDGEWFFEFSRNPDGRLPASGTDALAGVTSWDMTFSAADEIIAVGLSYLGRNNFQWFSQAGDRQPILYGRATFSDGSTAMSQIELQQQAAGSFDVFIGFEAPDGLVITGLHVWHRGNNNRAFGSIDDLGLIAIPEPRVYAALFGLFGLFLVWLRRRG